jgi:hypothetical protein
MEENKAIVQRLFITDGRVTELRGAADRLGMLTQLGILPDIG